MQDRRGDTGCLLVLWVILIILLAYVIAFMTGYTQQRSVVEWLLELLRAVL